MSKQKIYIKIDKPIEVGDLVRCVRDDGECKVGGVRKVSRIHEHDKPFFYIHESEEPCVRDYWEPVRKLKVGDRVQFLGEKILTVTAIHPDSNIFEVEEYPNGFFATRQFTFYQPEKHDLKPDQRREFMERAVAEMVVESLDEAERSNCNRMTLQDAIISADTVEVCHYPLYSEIKIISIGGNITILKLSELDARLFMDRLSERMMHGKLVYRPSFYKELKLD